MPASTSPSHTDKVHAGDHSRGEERLSPSSRHSRFSSRSGANHGVVGCASDSTRQKSYQMQQYADSPRHNDPYSPGQRGHHGTGVGPAEADAATPLLQTDCSRSKL